MTFQDKLSVEAYNAVMTGSFKPNVSPGCANFVQEMMRRAGWPDEKMPSNPNWVPDLMTLGKPVVSGLPGDLIIFKKTYNVIPDDSTHIGIITDSREPMMFAHWSKSGLKFGQLMGYYSEHFQEFRRLPDILQKSVHPFQAEYDKLFAKGIVNKKNRSLDSFPTWGELAAVLNRLSGGNNVSIPNTTVVNTVDISMETGVRDNFQEALKFTLKWEGGLSDNPADSGGRTNKGITQSEYNRWREYKGWPLIDVSEITDGEVEDIYFNLYWKPSKSNLMVKSLSVTMFDTSVNFGKSGAVMFLQEALGFTKEDVDGEFGDVTMAALKRQNQKTVAINMIYGRIAYRYKRVKDNPSQKVFLTGWLNRDNDLMKLIKEM